MKINWLVEQVMVWGLVGGLTVPVSALAATKQVPKASGQDLQRQVKSTANKVIPAVVSIASTVMVRDQAFGDEALPFGLFKEPPTRRQYGQGSGVIVAPDGYIITNNHVVADAVDVEVVLADRRQYKGRVVATDPKTDVAVVKIQATKLPTVAWGDSSQLDVGDFVLAIGNPLGLSRTVTFGIVSAVGRADVGVADFEDFIQTDAPINPGNSGGALVNIHGELVGINTAIASPTGGSVGVGFAIPSNMARAAMQSLIKTGRVVRGFLGAYTQDVSPPLGKIFHLPDVKGAIVTDVQSKGSAERAGLKRGDVVVRFDGGDVMDSGHLRNLVAQSSIGSKHRLDLIREGKVYQAELIIQEAPRERTKKTQTASTASTVHPLAGVVFDDVTPPLARQMDLPVNNGVVVTDIEEGSLAEASGLQPGDVVLELNRQYVPNFSTLQRLADPLKPADLALLLVNRQGNVMYIPIQGE
ncbi:MAG: Do family serine endopeptidase [Nitrospira sp.]|nr:Do family serine endopeptidase [Nitrospira sp.]MDH4242966.1 Do family serine endopeptidase [Nitrospira sp.]MDH4354379.1 Do family serine endopeptidase [Nitrospira sp.]MDH5320481.1 Do family serine endopeptidase [Nitrospira sp.]